MQRRLKTRDHRSSHSVRRRILTLALIAFGSVVPVWGQDAPNSDAQTQSSSNQPSAPGTATAVPGTVTGTVLDQSGAMVAAAQIKLTREDSSLSLQTASDTQGQFVFSNVAPGPFQFTVTAPGFAAQTVRGVLHSGEIYNAPQIALAVAANVAEVDVGLSRLEVAQEQIEAQEKQRVLGVIPNFYVSYEHNPAPLTSKQKFSLAWKTTIDPISFLITGAIAGVEQADNSFSGYGQGAQGYGKRYGAAYADFVSGTFIGAAILPSLLKQDPRYFYKGEGSKKSRVLYALANSVICKGDNGRWQANYSNILGSFAAGGISNIYYPASDREGAELTIQNGLIGIGATGLANVLQEFVVKKFTRGVPDRDSEKP